MLTEAARVVAVDDGGLWVETVRRSTCNACSVRQGCGHGLLERLREGQRGLVWVLPGKASLANCAVGDEVSIGIPESLLLRASLLLYCLPLLTLLLGAGLAAALFSESADAAAMLGAVAGLLCGLALVRWHAWRHRGDPAMHPVLLGPVLQGATAPLVSAVLARSET